MVSDEELKFFGWWWWSQLRGIWQTLPDNFLLPRFALTLVVGVHHGSDRSWHDSPAGLKLRSSCTDWQTATRCWWRLGIVGAFRWHIRRWTCRRFVVELKRREKINPWDEAKRSLLIARLDVTEKLNPWLCTSCELSKFSPTCQDEAWNLLHSGKQKACTPPTSLN